MARVEPHVRVAGLEHASRDRLGDHVARCQVGEDGKGPRAVTESLREAGVTDVTMTLYPDARHELLNETNRDEVIGDLVAWLDAHLPA